MKFVAVKLCRVVKPVPLVFRANTVPLPDKPSDVPYRVLPDMTKVCGMTVGAVRETMQVHKTRAVGVDLEHHAIAAGAAVLGRPIQGAARKNQSSFSAISVAVGKKTGGRIGLTRTKSMQEW